MNQEELESARQIGPLVKSKRESLNLGIEELAAKIFVTQERLIAIESGEIDNLTMTEIINLCIAMDCTIDEITGWDNNNNPNWHLTPVPDYYK